MLKKYVTMMMTFVLLLTCLNVFAAPTTKKKSKKTKGSSARYVSKNIRKKKGSHNRKTARRYKRSGTGPDLRALTTESPESPYTENSDNGINSVETKPGL